ncbi:MAG: alpha-L-fucosidase [Bacteroidales bacterium]
MKKKPQRPTLLSSLSVLFFLLTVSCRPDVPDLTLPSPGQVDYQRMEMVGFIHFGMNTFYDKEWGYGDEDPARFNPSDLDAEQWVLAAKAAGMKELILTAKHHDGFCLWPSAYTEHSVKNSPFRNGQGDLVREFAEACRKHGLEVGLYLSPWDRNHAGYGTPAYIEYYRNQLRELLTGYGEISEIWFDGANGGDGYYGGARTERRVDKETYYDWPATMALAKELQPGVRIFSDAGPDIRWVGNEHGFAGETFWSTIDKGDLVIGASDSDYLNRGEAGGPDWILGQCDVSIRPGWFYHTAQDSLVKTTAQLLDIYHKSVGRNAVLLLNLPPDPRGLIHETDVARLTEFREQLDRMYGEDLARNGEFSDKTRGEASWTYLLSLDEARSFDRIVLAEDIASGQRVSAFRVETEQENGEWARLVSGTTIGYKRILTFPPVSSRLLRITVDSALAAPALLPPQLYLAE